MPSWIEAQNVIYPLMLWTAGLILYGIFTFKFYRYIAKKDVLALNLHQYNTAQHEGLRLFLKAAFWFMEFVVAFPVFVFFWFLVLTVLLAALSSSGLAQTALIAMALIAAVRVTAYFHEDLSRDLAKMMPFAVLGVFLVSSEAVSIAEEIAEIGSSNGLLWTAIYYLGFIVVLEFVLRIGNALLGEAN